MSSEKQPLPAYYSSQKLRCRVKSRGKYDQIVSMATYAVEVPGDRREAELKSNGAELKPGDEVEAIFVSLNGRKVVLAHCTDTYPLEVERPDSEIKEMSEPFKGSLVSVTVLEKLDAGYKVVYKDFWGEDHEGSMRTELQYEPGTIIDVAVAGWPGEMKFVSIPDIEAEVERRNERSRYLTGQETSLKNENTWLEAVIGLSPDESVKDLMGDLREKAESLIARLQKEGLRANWDETVEALKMYAYPMEEGEISDLLERLSEQYEEDDLVEFFSYRLHPDKNCPLTPLSRDLLQALRQN